MEFYIDIEDSNDKLRCVTNVEDEFRMESVRTMLDNNEEECGHMRIEMVPDEEIDCYDWSDEELEMIKDMTSHSELYQVFDGIGDFEQPIGIVILMWD